MARDRTQATPQLAIGIFIMSVGALMLLERLQLVNAARALRFWPLALIAVGGAMVLRRTDTQGRFWGFGWLFIGSWLLLNSMGLLRVGFWQLFWPLLLVAIGLNLIRQTMRHGGSTQPGAASGSLFAIMAESKRTVMNEPFSGCSMTAMMGGCILDLRQATVPPGAEMVVDVFGVLAGHEIVVPPGWTIVPDVVSILASVEDKRLPAIVDAASAVPGAQPRLVIRGFMLLAGVTVKS